MARERSRRLPCHRLHTGVHSSVRFNPSRSVEKALLSRSLRAAYDPQGTSGLSGEARKISGQKPAGVDRTRGILGVKPIRQILPFPPRGICLPNLRHADRLALEVLLGHEVAHLAINGKLFIAA
jgi:hypothetical protein